MSVEIFALSCDMGIIVLSYHNKWDFNTQDL